MSNTKQQETFLGHPKGLYVLFFTELWERFSYYGMKAMLVLYMSASITSGGLGYTDKEALNVLAFYVLLVYTMAIPGGFIADKFLGQRKAVMIGGALLCVGHGLMAIPETWSFYTSLGIIILGVGLLKPNISTMVGSLYEKNPEAKDSGFTIFYMGINIGAFIAGIIVGTLRVKYGWHWAFGAAGIGMAIGQIVYIWGQKYLGDIGLLDSTNKEIKKLKKKFQPLTKLEIKKLKIVAFSFLIVLVFFAAFEQAGGLMSLYTENYTDRGLFNWEIPTEFFQSLNPFYIILLSPIVSLLWIKLAKKGKEPSSIFKMGLGVFIVGIGFLFMIGAVLERGDDPIAKSAMSWLLFAYLFHTIGELTLSPVSLSFVTKMAPKRWGSSVMGLYFAITGIGGFLAAEIGAFSKNGLVVFGAIAGFTIIFGVVVIMLSKKINRIASEESNLIEEKI